MFFPGPDSDYDPVFIFIFERRIICLRSKHNELPFLTIVPVHEIIIYLIFLYTVLTAPLKIDLCVLNPLMSEFSKATGSMKKGFYLNTYIHMFKQT